MRKGLLCATVLGGYLLGRIKEIWVVWPDAQPPAPPTLAFAWDPAKVLSAVLPDPRIPPLFREPTGDPEEAARRHEPYVGPGMFDTCTARMRGLAARQCSGRPCDLILVGDSILEALSGGQCYYGVAQAAEEVVFQGTFAHYNTSLILARGGDQTPHTLHALGEVLPLLDAPKLFFVLLGTNNLGNNWSTAGETAAGVRAVVARLRAAFPDSRVLLHPILPRADDRVRKTIPGMGGPRQPFQATVDEANLELAAFARAAAGLELVDCSQVFPGGDGPEAWEVTADLLHPNAVGYERWLRCLNSVIGRFLA